ncbi:hypothetical protein [Estrella lausannensis]|uniref:Putative membrane protein n=1 Tax=Estrella lausannensis TaxID=483423 RepID=A0A0H5DR64_9BACT|nr:hypothetical protein [Estrella lausannensis]CRX38134.1 putative membrane protein [Estrella lausannensis]
MKGLFSKLFNLYEGEERNAFLFTLLGFLWSLSINLGLKNADALFLIHVGAEYLPYVYIATALGMILPALILIRIINAIEPSRIFLSVIATAFFFYTLFFLAVLHFGELPPACWFVLRFVSFQMEAVLMTGYWTFLDQYHNMQDAKRVFVLFSSAVFLGQAVTGLIMSLGVLEFYQILLLILVLFAVTATLTIFIRKTIHVAHDDTAIDEASEYKNLSVALFIKELFKSRFALFVMANNFCIYLMWMTTEYNYMSFFDQAFDPPTGTGAVDSEQAFITLFLGRIIFAVSVINLLFGLFLYSRLIRRFGVGALLFFSPALLLAAYTGWISIGGLAFPLIAYFVAEGTLEVVDDSNFNLLLNVIPKKIKYKVRVAIESMLEPIGMLTSGILLMITGFNTLYLGLFVVAILLSLAFIIRRKYPSAVVANLTASAIHFERPAEKWAAMMDCDERKEEEIALYKLLASATEKDKLFAIEAIFLMGEESFFNLLLSDEISFTPLMKQTFIRCHARSAFNESLKARQMIVDWSKDEALPSVRGEALFFLASHHNIEVSELVQYANSKEPLFKASYLLARKRSQQRPDGGGKCSIAWDAEIDNMLSTNDMEAIITALRLLGEDSSHQTPYRLLPYLEHPSIQVQREAIQSMAAILTPSQSDFAVPLLKFWKESKDPFFRHYLIKALGQLSNLDLYREMLESGQVLDSKEKQLFEEILRKSGPPAIPMLASVLEAEQVSDSCRALSAKVLGHLDLETLHTLLQNVVDKEIEKARFYLTHSRAYAPIQETALDKLLAGGLSSAFSAKIEFIIHLLSSAGEISDPEAVCRLYRSKNAKIRSQVIETLEKTCKRAIFRKLRPLIEEQGFSGTKRILGNDSGAVLPLEDLLNFLAESPSLSDQIMAAAALSSLHPQKSRESLKVLAQNNSPIIQSFAKELLGKI